MARRMSAGVVSSPRFQKIIIIIRLRLKSRACAGVFSISKVWYAKCIL